MPLLTQNRLFYGEMKGGEHTLVWVGDRSGVSETGSYRKSGS